MSDFQVTYRGHLLGMQGYSFAARGYMLPLFDKGVDIRAENIDTGYEMNGVSEEDQEAVQEMLRKERNKEKKNILIHHSQPHSVDPNYERQTNGYDKVIINTVWETTKVPDNWFPAINQADAVIVPSSQNYDALKDSGVTNTIYVVPHGVDADGFNPKNEPFPLLDVQGEDRFNFLSIFQWQHRKSPDVLLKAFWEEFSAEDNVSLIIKSYWGNDFAKREQRILRSHIAQYKMQLGVGSDTAPLFFSGSPFDDEHLKGLYTLSDIFVLPSRGEGVGMPYMEAMASGIPVIATAWGGQTDFVSGKNGYLLDCKMVPCLSSEGLAPNFSSLFTNEMEWAEPSVTCLRNIMREAYNNQDVVKKKGENARDAMTSCSWDSSGIALLQALEGVL